MTVPNASMMAKLEALQQALIDNQKTYQSLLEFALQKKRVIIDNKIDELAQMTSAEEILLEGAGQAEAKRYRLQKEIAGEMQLAPQEVSLSQLIMTYQDAMPGLADRAAEFTRVVQELAEVNRENTQLIEFSLAYVQFNLNLLTQAENSNGFYGDQGLEAPNVEKKPSWMIDRKA